MVEPAKKSKRTRRVDEATELFGPGWLERQLDRVLDDLAGKDESDRPRLTGARAATMAEPAWLDAHSPAP